MASIIRHLPTNDVITLPVINITDASQETGRQMIDAAATHGFLYINTRGTGFRPEVVERLFELSSQFFASPEAEKVACKIGPNNRGWTGMHSETLDPLHQRRGDFKEAFNIGESINNRFQQPIPKSLQNHQCEILDFERNCRNTCHRILRLLALGLEIPDSEWFSSRHKIPSGCTLRFLHYPALPVDTDYQPDVDIRAGAHSDYGSITLLFQRPSQPGLEILTNHNDTIIMSMADNCTLSGNRSEQQHQQQQKWLPVPIIPEGYDPEKSSHSPESSNLLPPILVNIGDLLSYWTNGLLRSTVHRVVFPQHIQPSSSSPSSSSSSKNQTQDDLRCDQLDGLDRKSNPLGDRPTNQPSPLLGADRYSIAYFCHPTDTTALETIPSRLVPRPVIDEDGGAEERTGWLRVGYGGGSDGAKVMTAKEHLNRRLEATYGV